MQQPNFSALLALESVARLGGVTHAARSLHLTQSAVSHRLRALERELGCELVERHGRGVRLTPNGTKLAQAAHEAFDVLRAALASLTRAQGERQVLSISCSPSFAIRFLVPRLAAFRSQHPFADLRIAADDVPVDPARAGADASVMLAAGPVAGLHSERLIEETVFPVMSPSLRKRFALRTVEDLARHTLLHDEALAHEPGRVSWSTWLAAAGARRVRASAGIRFSHAYLALEAALAGDGVALARRTLVADDLARGRLLAPFEPAVPSGLSYWLVTATDPASSPGLVALRVFLLSSLREAHGRVARAPKAGRRKTAPRHGQRAGRPGEQGAASRGFRRRP